MFYLIGCWVYELSFHWLLLTQLVQQPHVRLMLRLEAVGTENNVDKEMLVQRH